MHDSLNQQECRQANFDPQLSGFGSDETGDLSDPVVRGLTTEKVEFRNQPLPGPLVPSCPLLVPSVDGTNKCFPFNRLRRFQQRFSLFTYLYESHCGA